MSEPPTFIELPPDAKAKLHSRTLWLNAASIAVVALGLILDQAQVFHLSAGLVAAAGIVIAVLNAVVRLFTNKPLSGTPGEAALMREHVEGAA